MLEVEVIQSAGTGYVRVPLVTERLADVGIGDARDMDASASSRHAL
jgi:hypothetical protein